MHYSHRFFVYATAMLIASVALAIGMLSGHPAFAADRITYTTVSGRSVQALYRAPTGAGPLPAVIYNHGKVVEDVGYTAAVAQGYDVADFVDALAEAGYVAIAPLRESATFVSQGTDIIQGAVTYLKNQTVVNDARIFVMGYSRGGWLTLTPAIADPNLAGAIFISPSPGSLPDLWPTMATRTNLQNLDMPVLVLIGAHEPNPDIVRNVNQFVSDLQAIGRDVESHLNYNGDHAWFQEVRSEYWNDVLAYLRAKSQATLPGEVVQSQAAPGSLIKLACPATADVNHPCKAVYYYGSDGKRHAFPNDKTYFTWYNDFLNVVTVTDAFMASRSLGTNVTYRPGVRMVKFISLPNVYAVDQNGTLRWVSSEEIARTIYGEGWNRMIDDVGDAFFGNYRFGADITGVTDFNPVAETALVPTIDIDKGPPLETADETFNPLLAGQPHPKIQQTIPACCNHPYWHTVYRAFSDDGRAWQKENIILKEHASVPAIIQKDDGSYILYYVNGSIDTLDCAISTDGRNFSPGNCTIYGFTETKAWDPYVVKLDNGLYRMYFFAPRSGGGDHRIMSALSKDGINWLQDQGVRFAHADILDPAVIKIGTVWRMYTGDVRRSSVIVVAKSTDGLNFVKETELNIGGGVPEIIQRDPSTYALYFCKNGIEVVTSPDGLTWSGAATAIPRTQGVQEIICDPSIIKTNQGTWVMYYKRTN